MLPSLIKSLEKNGWLLRKILSGFCFELLYIFKQKNQQDVRSLEWYPIGKGPKKYAAS